MANKLYEALLMRVHQVDNEMWLNEQTGIELPVIVKHKFANSRRFYQEKNTEKKKKRNRKGKGGSEDEFKQLEADYIWCGRFKKCFQYLLGGLLRGEAPWCRCFGDEVALNTAVEYIRGLELEGSCAACADTECTGEVGGECMARLPRSEGLDSAYDQLFDHATHGRSAFVRAIYQIQDISEINPECWQHPDHWLDNYLIHRVR